MRRRAFHYGDGSHKRYETWEEFDERRQQAEKEAQAEAIVEEHAPDDENDDQNE